jgi:hypothetical protein
MSTPRVVLEASIRDAVAKLDPQFGYADGFDEQTGKYTNLIWARGAPELFGASAVLVSAEAAQKQFAEQPARPTPDASPGEGGKPAPQPDGSKPSPGPAPSSRPKRFYGSVEIDTSRPVKAFDTILSAVVAELRRTPGAKVKLTLEIEAQAPDGFPENDVGVVRDNARQLKFKPDSTGFES